MERMSKEKESGTLLGVGTAYLPVKEIKGEFYVKVSDFTRCMDSMRKELEEENKKLNIKVASLEGEIKGLNYTIEKLHKELDECECSMHYENDEVGYRKRECKKLKEGLEKLRTDNIYEEGLYD